MIKKITLVLLIALLATAFLLVGCSEEEEPEQEPEPNYPVVADTDDSLYIVLATTVEDTDLLAHILPAFTEETRWEVVVVPASNSTAFELARNGDVDVLLVNSPALELQFIDDGYTQGIYEVMYNDFIIVGPADGAIFPNSDVLNTFDQILFFSMPFISRGDGSSVHLRELLLWRGFYLNQWNNPFYSESAGSMSATISLAEQSSAFTLTDRATWLAFPEADRGNLIIVCEDDFRLMNVYTAIAVSASDVLEGAEAFVSWITGSSAQELIGNFGLSEHGTSLFTPVN